MVNLTIICGKWLTCKAKQDSMKKLTIIAVIVSSLMISGCASRQTSLLLNDVESYIMERPDSALAVLDTMDRAHLSTDRLKAHHALLHAMALDKNYIDVTDDSLASVAVRYYSKHGSKKYLARSLYYKGLSYYYNKEYDKSIIELSKAEPIAETYDSLYLGFIKMLQANIYSANYSLLDEIVAIQKAYDIYSDLQVDYYISLAKLRLSKAYANNDMYHEAEMLLNELMHTENLPHRIKTQTMGDYAFLMGTRPDADYKTAVNYFEKTAEVEDGKHLSKQDYWVWAHALAQTGDLDRSQQIVDMLSSIDTSGTAYYWQYKIAKAQNKTSEAFTLHQKFSDKNNEEVIKALKQSISVVQRDYYQSQFREASLQIRVKNLMFIIVIILSVLIILVIILGVQKYMTKQKHEKEKLLEYAEEINRQLSQYKDENYPMLKKRFISLYKSRFETLGTLCNQYLQDRNRDDIEKVMFQKVMLLIEDIRNDNVRKANFESVLDTELDGIMTRFRNEIPKCKEWEVTMFGYLVAGFDSTTISRLMDFSLDQVYSYKRRLIQKIQTKKPEHSTQFLEMLT